MAQHRQPYDPWAVEGVNTLFVSGLPDDVKAREIHNLFRRRPGFDSCQLKYTGRGNQGVKFDPQTGSTLHIELARSNSRRKRKPGSGPYVVIDKRCKPTENDQEESSDDDTGDSDSDETASGGSNNDSAEDDLATSKSETTVDAETAVADLNQGQARKTVEGGIQPCSTLFIANLGPLCTEDELREALSRYEGFNVIKMRAKGGMPVAFADFQEIEQATKVMEELQGSELPSSDRGGMHIEYARSKMRKS
ncbi:protein WHI4 isoform X5 [Tripterygium wilfordii]|uniref:protein WHI4 isoform X5 n=1 Tax=Tripterygium wilfordii TaxID=458696 RepID=UPI0018F83013|nr:protein WHI4 isoform X5 [Tripterygium wilfordii]